MVGMNVGSVAEYAWYRIDSVPADVSGTAMVSYVNTSISKLQNYTGETIDTTNIAQKYHNILVNITAAYTLGRIAGIGVAHNVSLGEFSVGANSDSPEGAQMQIWLSEANSELKLLPRKMLFGKSFG